MEKFRIQKLRFPTIARIFIAVYIVSIIFLILLRSVNLNHLFPLDFHFQLDQGLVVFIIFGFLFYLFSIIISIGYSILHHRLRDILVSIFSLIISVPVSIVFMFTFMSNPEHTLSALINGEHLYVLSFLAGDFGEYNFYECSKLGLECKSLSSKISSYVEDPMKLVFDEKTDSIVAFQKRGHHTWISFVYKDLVRYFDWEQIAEFHNDVYMLNSNRQEDSTSFFISKCIDENESIGYCEILPFGYTSTGEKDVKLIYNEYLDALQVVAEDEIIYSYNGQSRCLSKECKNSPFE